MGSYHKSPSLFLLVPRDSALWINYDTGFDNMKFTWVYSRSSLSAMLHRHLLHFPAKGLISRGSDRLASDPGEPEVDQREKDLESWKFNNSSNLATNLYIACRD